MRGTTWYLSSLCLQFTKREEREREREENEEEKGQRNY